LIVAIVISSLFEESWIDIGAVDAHVAHDAILPGQVLRMRTGGNGRMTLQAE
jgi:hypothetical protein